MDKNYNKNPYYTNEDIAKAVKLASDFFRIEDGHQCMGNCTACLRCSNILFKQH